jgi:methyl-accepting chemotaxis protein
MSAHTVGSGILRAARGTGRFYRTVGMMIGSAIVLSATIIIYSQSNLAGETSIAAGDSLILAAKTLTPYMIAAVIAAITAMGVLALMPLRTMEEPTERMVSRLEEMASGDLATRLHINAEHPQLRDLASAINNTSVELSRQIAHLKVVNRHQWEMLCGIRAAAQAGDHETVLRNVDVMEKNWLRIAEVEQQLITG